jgi:hypothetical protein
MLLRTRVINPKIGKMAKEKRHNCIEIVGACGRRSCVLNSYTFSYELLYRKCSGVLRSVLRRSEGVRW